MHTSRDSAENAETVRFDVPHGFTITVASVSSCQILPA
jgi:hypothetical protein